MANPETQPSLAQESRMIEYILNPSLQNLLSARNTQAINLLVGGNAPESTEAVINAIDPTASDKEGLLTALKAVDDLPWQMYDRIVEQNTKGEKALRFIDTPARIQLQLVAFKERIREMVNKQTAESIVFTVCGASPPDLQAVRAIQELNLEFGQDRENGKKRPELYAAIFLPGDEEAVIPYSVEMGLHPEVWRELYENAKKDSEHVFIHEPRASAQFASAFTNPEQVSFSEARKLSTNTFGHNRGPLVDVNRTITAFAARPPVFGMFAESFEVPKQLRGSGIELVARLQWQLINYYGLSEEEAFHAIQIEQAGFIATHNWTLESARELYRKWEDELSAEYSQGHWLRRFVAVQGTASIEDGPTQKAQITETVRVLLDDGYGLKVGLTSRSDILVIESVLKQLSAEEIAKQLRIIVPSQEELLKTFTPKEVEQIEALLKRLYQINPPILMQQSQKEGDLLKDTMGVVSFRTREETSAMRDKVSRRFRRQLDGDGKFLFQEVIIPSLQK